MSEDTSKIQITDLPDTTPTEVNFEDLIKVSDLKLQTIKDEGEIEKTEKTVVPSSTSSDSVTSVEVSTVATTNTTSSTAITSVAATNSKIIQKLKSTVAPIKSGTPGQVVILQRPSGQPVPIRISGSATVNSNQNNNNQNKQVTIQVLKMPDGSFVQIKNNKALNLTNLSNVTQMNIGTKRTSNGQGQSIIIKTTASTDFTSSLTPTTATTSNSTETNPSKTPTVTEIQIIKSSVDNQKVKIIESVKQSSPPLKNTSTEKIITTQNVTLNSIATISTDANNTTSSPTIPTTSTITVTASATSTGNTLSKQTTQGKDIVIKTENDGTKQIFLPHHVLKLSSTSTGPVQAIQIPGKAGVQYVKVLGTTSSSTGNNSVVATKNLNISVPVSSKDGISVNSSQLTPISSSTGQKIIVNAKARQGASSIVLNKDGFSTQKSLITIPMLKKITENDKASAIIKKEDDNQTQEKNEIRNDNKSTLSNGQQPQRMTKILSNNKTPQLFMISKELLKKVQVSGNSSNDNHSESNKSTELSTVSTKKLYSVLKPNISESTSNTTALTTEDINSPSSSNRKRSPSPPDGPRRKHCNCTRSQCLKLYCDCFANGEFCQDCNCKECFNNLDNEIERQKAIKICLERNPNAFKPKITKARDQSDLRLHNKGCNCKRSGCLKNYCECYEAKIACSSNCKCLGCRNVEDRPEIDQIQETPQIPQQNYVRGNATKRRYSDVESTMIMQSISDDSINKQTYNFITEDVVDATVQCMFAQAEECKKSDVNEKNSERMIIEELGRCLVEIIDFSIRNIVN